jgi:hypothetical protein
MVTEMDYWWTAAGISHLQIIRNEKVREILRVEVEDIRKKQLI